MWIPEWNVLVVDDEPDVLQVTNLILKNLDVDGIPVKVHTATSKAEALDLLHREFVEEDGPGTLAVALIDVVMETDNAGLELCEYIRADLNNHLTQLYIRTGQPGVAPERYVINGYNISGYFTKVEATEDKLYTLVKSGARQYWFSAFSLMLVMMLNAAISAASVSRDNIGQALSQQLGRWSKRRGGAQSRLAIWAGDEPFILAGYSRQQADDTRKRLSQLNAQPIGPGHESAVLSPDSNEVLVTIPAGPGNPPAAFLGDGYGVPAAFVLTMMSWTARSLATLWQQAGLRERM